MLDVQFDMQAFLNIGGPVLNFICDSLHRFVIMNKTFKFCNIICTICLLLSYSLPVQQPNHTSHCKLPRVFQLLLWYAKPYPGNIFWKHFVAKRYPGFIMAYKNGSLIIPWVRFGRGDKLACYTASAWLATFSFLHEAVGASPDRKSWIRH